MTPCSLDQSDSTSRCRRCSNWARDSFDSSSRFHRKQGHSQSELGQVLLLELGRKPLGHLENLSCTQEKH